MSESIIDSLGIEIVADSKSATDSIDNLSKKLANLKSTIKGLGFGNFSSKIRELGSAVNSISVPSVDRLNKLTNALSGLANVGKIQSNIGGQLSKIATGANAVNNDTSAKIRSLATALAPLGNIGKTNLGAMASSLQKVPPIITAFEGVNVETFNAKIKALSDALKPLTEMPKQTISGLITQLKKLPEVANALNGMNLETFKRKIQEVAAAIKPLADEMNKVAAGFSSFPSKLQKLLITTNKANTSLGNFRYSLKNLIGFGSVGYVFHKITQGIAKSVNSSNQYIETMNLFSVSMGEYTEEAVEYAETVGELMGINPVEFMRNQGIFMTLASGFGIASDRAAIMSKNLTQLGYDIASFYNYTDVNDAMLKVQSGLAGELEPLRRIGYDLSQARLEAVALSLGIDKAFTSMTQAEKAQLRYYAMMTQVTQVQGDMARTLEAPANQLRILRAQLEQLSISFGNLLLPLLSKVLPVMIAIVQVLKAIIDMVATLLKIELPEFDFGADAKLKNFSIGAEDSADALGDAASAAKKLKDYTMGIDELNVINPDSGGSGGGSVGGLGGAGLDFELPQYDFIDEAVKSRIQELKDQMLEWLGITEDIDSWGELFDTKLGGMLTTVGLIGAGFAGWKIAKSLGGNLQQCVGFAASFAGGFLLADGAIDAVTNGVDWGNVGKMIGGVALIAGGLGLAFGSVGAAIGLLIGGFVMLGVGIADWIKNGECSNKTLLLIVGGIMAVGGAIALLCGGWIPLVVAAVVAVIVAIVAKWDEIKQFFIDLWEKVKEIFRKMWEGEDGNGGIKGFAINAWESIKTAWENAGKWFNETILEPIKKFFKKIWEGEDGKGGIKGIATGVWEGIKNAWIKATTWFQFKVLEPIKVFFLKIWVTIKNAVTGAWDGIKEVWNKVSTWFDENVLQPIKNFFKKVWEGADGNGGIKGIVTSVWTKIKEAWDKATQWFTDLVNSIKQTFKDIFYDIEVIVTGVWATIKEAWRLASEWFDKNVLQPIKTFFKNIWEGADGNGGIKGIATSAWEGIKTAWKTASKWFDENVLQPIKKFFTKIWEGEDGKGGIKGAVTNVWEGIKTAWENAPKWFNDTILEPIKKFFTKIWEGEDGKGGIKGAVANVWEGIKTAWKNASTWFNENVLQPIQNFFKNIWEGKDGQGGILGTVTGVWDDIKTGASNAWEGIKTAFDGVVSWFKNLFTGTNGVTSEADKAWGDLFLGATDAWTNVKSAFSGMAEWFKTTFSNAWEKVKGVFSTGGQIFAGITDGIAAAFKKIVNKIIEGINNVVAVPFNAINTALGKLRNFKIGEISPFSSLVNISVPKIPLLAQGGFPTTGQLFIAREAGAELVGTIGGRSAVANNDQIVEAVSAGVYSAVMSAMSDSNNDGSSNIIVNLDGEKIYENQLKVARQRGYNLGMGAFSFG